MNRRNFIIGASGAVATAGLAYTAWQSSVGSIIEYESYAARLRADLVPANILDVIRFATLAANSHNTQPWRFHTDYRSIDVLPDFTRRTPVVDPDDHHLFVSLGCAAANLALAAAASGRPGEISLAEDGNGVHYEFTSGSPRLDPLFTAINTRQSTRAEYDGHPVVTADLKTLIDAAAIPGTNLAVIVDRAQIGRVRDLVVTGSNAQITDPAFMRELKHWIRFNPRSAIATGDGLFAAASGNPSLPTAIGGLAIDLLLTAGAEGAKSARQIDTSAGLAIFVGDEPNRDHWIRVGQACQRFMLAATQLGLKTAFVNQPVEVVRLRSELAALIGSTRRPDIVLRFGYGPTLPYSPRRSVASVIV